MLIYFYDKQFDIYMLRLATILKEKKSIFDPTYPAFPYVCKYAQLKHL